MAQITGAFSARNAKLLVSTNGAVWTDISGAANSIAPGGGTRQVEATATLDGDTMILTSGKREPVDLEVKVIYTEGATDAFEVVRVAYEAGTALYVRWSPKAGVTGDFQFTSDAGLIEDFVYPPADASDAKPVMTGFKLKTPKITKAAVV